MMETKEEKGRNVMWWEVTATNDGSVSYVRMAERRRKDDSRLDMISDSGDWDLYTSGQWFLHTYAKRVRNARNEIENDRSSEIR